MLWLIGWTAAGFLAGCLLMHPRFSAYRSETMRDRFSRLGPPAGMTYAAILHRIGSPPQRAFPAAEGRFLRRWEDRDYLITLAFDHAGRCLGVEDEYLGPISHKGDELIC